MRVFLSQLKIIVSISGLFSILERYEWTYAFAYIPIMVIWGYFLGIPPIIATFRIKNTYTDGQFRQILVSQIILVFFLFLLINLIGINLMRPYVLIAGVITGMTMQKSLLIAEAEERYGKRRID
jgi:hypothetical protein